VNAVMAGFNNIYETNDQNASATKNRFKLS